MTAQLPTLIGTPGGGERNNPFRWPDSRQSSRWWEYAACRMENSEMFFPCIGMPRGERKSAERQAKLVCARCPVRAECLEAALDGDERYGIWGGYSAQERRRKFGQGR